MKTNFSKGQVVKLINNHGLFKGVDPRIVARNVCIVDSFDPEFNIVTTKILNKIFTVPTQYIENVVVKPQRFVEEQLFGLKSMMGFYSYNSNGFYIRWFHKNDLVANFVGTQPMSTVEIEIKEKKLFKQYFRQLVRNWEHFFNRNGVKLQGYSLDPIKNNHDKLKVMLNILSDYIILGESKYCSVKEYLSALRK